MLWPTATMHAIAHARSIQASLGWSSWVLLLKAAMARIAAFLVCLVVLWGTQESWGRLSQLIDLHRKPTNIVDLSLEHDSSPSELAAGTLDHQVTPPCSMVMLGSSFAHSCSCLSAATETSNKWPTSRGRSSRVPRWPFPCQNLLPRWWQSGKTRKLQCA